MDASLLTLIATIALPVVAFLTRKRIAQWLGRLLFAESVKFVRRTYFDETEIDTPDGPKRVLRPSAALQSLFTAVTPTFVEAALASVKLKLPKFAPINPTTGALDFTAGIAAKMADGKNVKPEEIAKTLFMQFGVPFIQEKLGPFLQTLTAGVGKPTPAKEAVHPFLKELGP